jgi:PST family polysaccharide transporter
MGDKDIGGKTLTALKWGYGGAVARALSQLVIQMLLARLLGPEAFGQAMAAVLVLSIGWILSEGGFGTALIQKTQLEDADVGFALGWVLLLSCTTGALVVLGSHWLALWLGGSGLQNLIIASGVLIPLQAVANIPASLMRRNFDVRRSQLIYLGSYVLVYGGVGLPLAWAGAGAWSLVVAAGLQTLLNLVGNYLAVRHTLRPRLRGATGLAQFGLQVTGANVMGWIAENTDRFLVNRFWGTAALGEYTAAISLSRAPAGLLVSAAQSVTLASASRLQDDTARLGRSYLALLGVITMVTGPLFTLMAMHAQALVHLLYGARWAHAGLLFAAFCASLPFYSILAVSGPVLWAINVVRQDLYTQIFSFIAVALGFYAMQAWPLAQAAWLIPLIYLLRAAWIYHALAALLHLAHRRALRAVAGALLLSALAAAVSALLSLALAPLAAMVAASVSTLVLAILALRGWPHALLAPEFVTLLRNRAVASSGLQRLCRWMGLKPTS